MACLRGSPSLPGASVPQVILFSVSVGDHRPGSRRPPVLSFPAQGCPRERAGPRLARPRVPVCSPSPHVVVPLLGTPSFYSKALTVTQGLAPEPPTPQTLAFPKGPVLTEPQATDRPGLGTWLPGARARPHVKPHGQGGTKLGTLSMRTLPSPSQWVLAGVEGVPVSPSDKCLSLVLKGSSLRRSLSSF